MKRKLFPGVVCIMLFVASVYPQSPQSQPQTQPQVYQAPIRLATDEAVENISRNMNDLTKSVEALNRGLKSFFESYTSSQGFRLSPKQQTLLMAFEILNRAEQRMANLQKMRLDIAERQTPMRLQLARIEDDVLPQSIDRYVSTRGTTNANELRNIRRTALEKERGELSRTLRSMEEDMRVIDDEIRETQSFIVGIRTRIFPELRKELSDL